MTGPSHFVQERTELVVYLTPSEGNTFETVIRDFSATPFYARAVQRARRYGARRCSSA